jgi:hypothetical protein
MIRGKISSIIQRGFDIQPRYMKRRTLVNHLANVSWLTVVNRIGVLVISIVAVHYVITLI